MHIDPNVQLVTQPYRRILFHIRQQIEAELQRIEDLDIIEHVDGPTDCVLLIVVASKPKRKSKQICICVDMRLQNLEIKCTCHIIPTIDDTIGDFNGAHVFSKLNLSPGYHPMLLPPNHVMSPRLQHMLDYADTNVSRFEINSPAEIFQNAKQNALESLEGVRNM